MARSPYAFDNIYIDDYNTYTSNNPFPKETIDERIIGVIKKFEKMFGISYF